MFSACVCPCWTGLCPGARPGGTPLIPVHVPAGSSQQRSSSQCPLTPSPPPQPVWLCLLLLPLLLVPSALAERASHAIFSTLLSCRKLLAPLLHLLLFLSCLLPPPPPSSPLPSPSSSRCPAPGQGHLPPPGFPVLWGEVWSEARGWVSVCLSLSRSRLRSRTGRAALASIPPVQPALPTGF